MEDKFKNIILIGMPGSGKTVIGRKIASLALMKFIDLDKEIEKKSAMPVPIIFERYGEDYFRKLEMEIVVEFARKTGLVIATGGGVVTREENYPHLIRNGRIYLIERDIDKLATQGRPLSKNKGAIHLLWRERKRAYKKFADHIVKNIGVEETAKMILEEYNENFIN